MAKRAPALAECHPGTSLKPACSGVFVMLAHSNTEGAEFSDAG